MKCNVGTIDKVVRIVLGVVLIAYGVMASNIIVGVIGLIPLLTGLFSFCPLYTIFGLNTQCNKDEPKES